MSADPTPSRRSNGRSWAPLLLFLGALVLVTSWAGIKAWRTGSALLSLQAHQEEIETLAAGGLSSVDPQEATSLVMAVRADVVTLNNELGPLMRLGPHLGWIPRFGPLATATPQLLEMADAGSEAAVYLTRSLGPGMAILEKETGQPVEQMVDLLESAQPDVAQAAKALKRVVDARETLGETSDLPWRVRKLIDEIDSLLPMAVEGVRLLQVLPELLGGNGPRRYLVIAQNEDEIRATGGFITGAGAVTVNRGQIVDFQFQDANFIDNWRTKPYEFPPDPYYDFMRLELFLFRDANFWPDFPTSAEKAMELYSYGQDVPELDGAIAFDQRFLQLLLQATGPIIIPEADLSISHENVVETLRSAWSIDDQQAVGEWVNQRKAFLATFAVAILQNLQSDLSSLDPLLLARALERATREKHLQLYVRQQSINSVLDELNWDGRVDNTGGQDFLMVVDTNMGYNKVNRLIDRRISYEVTLGDDHGASADLSVDYTHRGKENGEACIQGTLYDEDPSYTENTNKCYWNYLRVYAPLGSTLLTSSEHMVDGDTLISDQTWNSKATVTEDLPGLTTFANFLMLPRESELRTRYSYRLPEYVVDHSIAQNHYQLAVLKQAGSMSQPAQVTVNAPEGTEILAIRPEPSSIEGNTVHFDLSLNEDLLVSVIYQ